MKLIRSYFLFFLISITIQLAKAQLNAPSLRCVSVLNSAGDVQLTWQIPSDPSGSFLKYEIFKSVVPTGPYSSVGVVNSYSQNTFIVTGTTANVQSQYFFIKTINTSNVSSASSDTLRSLFLNLVNPFDGIVYLNWNKTHTPLLPSSSSTYTLSRKTPTGLWNVVKTGTGNSFNDTIMICNVSYDYKVEISDASGCVSKSNEPSGVFANLQKPPILLLDSVSININNGNVTIGWEPSYATDATKYIVYKKNNIGVLIPVDTIVGHNNSSYTYTASSSGAQTEIFSVAAMDSCGNLSIPSVGHKTMLLKSSYDLCGRTVNLTWNAYENMYQGVFNYDVYCSVNGGAYSVVGTVTGTSFAHSGLNSGDNYCYFVRVRNTDLSISASSNKVCELAKTPQAPSYVYINSVSVNAANQIEVTYTVDNTKPFKGVNLLKSVDGVTFTSLGFNSSSGASLQVYTDNDVKVDSKTYYYKLQITDSCGNPASFSNVSKNMIVHVTNDHENIFFNTLTWDNYTTWLGNVSSYNIYRAVNGVFDPSPIANVNSTTFTYIDNVQDFVSEKGKFGYYVEAVEGTGNTYGFMDKAQSNRVEAYVEANVFVPNAFAPKGINNVWLPISQYVEKTDYKVMVFDRWGTKVFETASDTEGWDGKGTTDDVYVYIIEYKNARGEYIQIKGHLNIVR